jgi:hypothetical protein
MPLYTIDVQTLMSLVLGRPLPVEDQEHMPFLLEAIAAVAEIDRTAAAVPCPGAPIPALLPREGRSEDTTPQQAVTDVGRMLRQGTSVERCVEALEALISDSCRLEVDGEHGTEGREIAPVVAEQPPSQDGEHDENIEFELDLNDYVTRESERDADGVYQIAAVDAEQYFDIPLAFDFAPHPISEP